MRRVTALISLFILAGCNFSDRGLSKLQVVEDLTLGSALEDIKQQWFLYSDKPLVVDESMSSGSNIVYRGVSRDPAVTGLYLFFDPKTKMLRQVEWRYQSSMTDAKEKELLDTWTRKLWAPSYHRRWDGQVFIWSDRKAQLQLYLADGICHLIQKLN
ncbi:MAG TPA: hypothetical protein VJ873_12595 [bacterium]|nr:hypothetical protein [bacterium]